MAVENVQPDGDFACAGWYHPFPVGFCDGTIWADVDEGIGSTDAFFMEAFSNPVSPLPIRFDMTAPVTAGTVASIRVGVNAGVNFVGGPGFKNLVVRVFDGAVQLGLDEIIQITQVFAPGADFYTNPIDVSMLGLDAAALADLRVEVEVPIQSGIIYRVYTVEAELTYVVETPLLYIDLADTDLYGLNRIAQKVTPDADWEVDGIFLDFVYASQPVTCYIHADNGGQPTGSLLGTSDAQVVAGSGPGGPETFNFASPVSLTSGVPYWFVFYSPQEDAFTQRNNAPAGSGRGIAAYNGAVWALNDYDFAQFKVLGDLPAAPTVGSGRAQRVTGGMRYISG